MPLAPYVAAGLAGLLLAEVCVSAALRRGWYDLRDTLANLAMALGNVVPAVLARLVAVPISYALYEYRAWDLPSATWVFVLLVLAEDHCFYWFHRCSHRVRLFWAAHLPHHSSARYNLSTALRLSWTTPWTGIPFWWPLPLLGFHPLWIVTAQAASLAFQFCLHTQSVGRLGVLEWIFNTPSHHRVHHGSDTRYIDKNYGGVLIVWDRLYGSFAREVEPPRYGLVHPLTRTSLPAVQFSAWRRLVHDLLAPASAMQRLRRLVGPPA